MGYERELLAITSADALEFFRTELAEIMARAPVDELETKYVASILAHYAQNSCPDALKWNNGIGWRPLPNLSVLFDNLITIRSKKSDPQLLERAGGQIMLLAGFFHNQMRKRHSLTWYNRLGQSFYEEAGERFESLDKKVMMRRISIHFPLWTMACQELGNEFFIH